MKSLVSLVLTFLVSSFMFSGCTGKKDKSVDDIVSAPLLGINKWDHDGIVLKIQQQKKVPGEKKTKVPKVTHTINCWLANQKF